MIALMERTRERWFAYRRDTRGSAAAEFAMWLGILVLPVLNAIDLGFYAYQSMQVQQAAQSAAQTAFSLCNATTAPVATNCSNLNTELNTAFKSTSLGTDVVWSTSSEAWYCVNTSDALTISGTAATINPSGSNSAGSMAATAPTCANGAKAGDYVLLSVSHTFKPIFAGTSIVTGVLPATITQTAWMRVN